MDNMEEIVAMLKSRFGKTTADSGEPPLTYKCEECHDNGWIWLPGRTVKRCACQLAREAEERLEKSGLSGTIRQQTFDSFETKNKIQQEIKAKAEAYTIDLLSAWGSPRMPWLYIGGNPGSGKTHICTAVCGEILKNNIGVKYMQWLNEARRLKGGVYDDDFEDTVSDYINVPVLYIDDLLKQKYTQYPVFTEADIKIAFTILNARYLMNKPTIISSEWSLIDQLLGADEGVFSRVYERCKGYTVNIDRKMENNYRLTK